jgi:hypothetical protein
VVVIIIRFKLPKMKYLTTALRIANRRISASTSGTFNYSRNVTSGKMRLLKTTSKAPNLEQICLTDISVELYNI